MIWYAELESKIFTILKTRITKKCKTKYPDLDFTTDDRTETPTQSPTVYLREIDSPEMANNLENNVVNMVKETIEIEVYALTRGDCHTVASVVREEMKALAFSIIQQSPPMTNTDWWRVIMRFQRPIGSGDKVR